MGKNGMFTSSTYSTDLKLFRELGLDPFYNISGHHEVGRVEFGSEDEDGSWVEIAVDCLPAQFWKFTIYCAETETITTVTTGSGSLGDFWPAVKLIADNMLVIEMNNPIFGG